MLTIAMLGFGILPLLNRWTIIAWDGSISSQEPFAIVSAIFFAAITKILVKYGPNNEDMLVVVFK